MNESDDSLDVIYVPGGPRVNRFHYPENVAVLDAALRENPRVHDYILAHEHRHYEIGYDEPRDWLRQLEHEFRTDLHRYLGTDDDARALRAYVNEDSPTAKEAFLELVHEFLFGFLRGLWQIPMMAATPLRAAYEHLTTTEATP